MPVKAVLLDIEGTVCPISFVKEVLYPYSVDALCKVVAEQWHSPRFEPYKLAFPQAHRGSPAEFEAHFKELVKRDVKAPYMKNLQGYLWQDGYAAGSIRAPVFPDVAPAISAWATKGIRVMIYSSGSVAAQKLFWKYTDAVPSDMTPLILDYFDTVSAGPKTDNASYSIISAKYPEIAPAEWLFLSDNASEVDAARAAGMQALLVTRPGNAPLPQDHHLLATRVEDFDQLAGIIQSG